MSDPKIARLCPHCRQRYMTLYESELGYCADCLYFKSVGVYTIKDYNDWLKGEKK